MTTGNISARAIQAASASGTGISQRRKRRISPSTVLSAMVLVVVVGIAVLFRGFV